MPRSSALVALALLSLSATAFAEDDAPEPREFKRRGVYYFRGRVTCPLAGVGRRAPDASNRLVLDDEHSTATLDPGRKLVLTNSHAYAEDTLIGCLLLLGTATTAGGDQVPIGVHLKINKGQEGFHTEVHVHRTVRDDLTDADFEPLQVVATDGETRQVIFTKTDGLRIVRQPPFGQQLQSLLTKVDDNLEGVGQDVTQPGARFADISLGFGKGFLSNMVLRAQLISRTPVEEKLLGSSTRALLAQGAWELRLTCLSSWLPEDAFRRDLFLLGLEDEPMLQGLRRHGLAKGETLSFVFEQGKQGTLRLGRAEKSIADATDLVRDYLECQFLGGVLAHQMTRRTTKEQAGGM